MNPRYDISLMVKVADMYYNGGLKQEEIAKELQISRSSISMILTEAREYGIVEINVRNPLLNNDELSRKFESLFKINRCYVIPTKIQDSEILTKLVGERMAHTFNEEIEDNNTVGIAWGRTCYEFMSSYNTTKKLTGINVLPLVGGSNRVSSRFQLNEMVRQFAEKVDGTPVFLHAPAYPPTIADKNLYMKSSSMKEIQEMWHSIDIALIGVGAPPTSYPSENQTDSEGAFNYEEPNIPIGDICARYYNSQGKFIKDEFYNRIIGISVEDLLKAKKVICGAAGTEKSQSIIAALKTNIIDIFICDEQTAKEVLKYV